VSVTVSSLCHFLLKLRPDSKILKLLDDNFGWRYFLVFMDAVVLELFGLCLLNFSKVRHKTPAVDGGFAFSFIVLVFYVGYYVATGIAIKLWLNARKENSALKPGEGNQRLATLTFIIAEYKQEKLANLLYFMPLFLAGKQMLVQILAISLSGQGWGQLVPIVIVEIAYVILLCIARPKDSLIWNIYDIFFASIAPVYIFANMGTLTSYMDDEKKQQNAGRAMASFLLISALITTVYVFARIILKLIEMRRPLSRASVQAKSGSAGQRQDSSPGLASSDRMANQSDEKAHLSSKANAQADQYILREPAKLKDNFSADAKKLKA